MKDAVLLFRRTSKDDLQQLDAVAALLSMFYEVVPTIAFEENFDVSLVLVDVLKRLEQPELCKEDSELLLSQLQNLLKIARQSMSMRWWQQPGKNKNDCPLSLIVCLTNITVSILAILSIYFHLEGFGRSFR